jgi:hypothetical protein
MPAKIILVHSEEKASKVALKKLPPKEKKKKKEKRKGLIKSFLLPRKF